MTADLVPAHGVRRSRRAPRAHWLILALVLTTIGASQVLYGFSRGAIGRASTQTGSDTGSVVVPKGPILFTEAHTQHEVATPPRQIALTFDDGPDPRWTPALLKLLRKLHVPATFFVVGARVLEHPGLVQEEWRDGHDVGIHTYTHAELESSPGWRRRTELALSQVALEATIGRRSSLIRLPYSSTVGSITRATLAEAHRLEADGYTVVFANTDGEDWVKGRAPAQIVARAQPVGTQGAVVLLHDGGGNRSRTLRATETLVRYLRARGDTFVTITQLLRIPRSVADPPASSADRFRADAYAAAYRGSGDVASAFTVLAILVAVLMGVRALLLVIFARRHARIERDELPPGQRISVIVPAYNEEAGIRATVQSLLDSRLPRDTDLQVIVVNDGSTDGTAAALAAIADPRLTVLSQLNAGKASALNTGLAATDREMIVTVDGDTMFDPDALARLVAPLLEPEVGAVSGNTKVTNRQGLLGRWQHLEYVIGFNLDRRMYDVLGCMPTVPGAIGAFRRSTLQEVGGFSEDTLAEDTDVTMAVHRANKRVVYVDDAIAYTEAPGTLGDLWRQRYRWCYGTLQSIWKHSKGMAKGHEVNRLGLVGIPYVLLFQVLLTVAAPVVDVFTVIGLLFGDRTLILWYFVGFTTLQLAVTAFALHLDHEPLRGMWVVPLQQFVYRQLMYLVVIQSMVSALSGTRLRWQKVRRYGTAVSEPGASAA
jgi:cellulose synthase/poly-beta-1,6-N-acetylglucosamine synthase-like glycosyltransferase/peptidoglycan/xylan/chitin deacetylase (PgdA/CDA1 family)